MHFQIPSSNKVKRSPSLTTALVALVALLVFFSASAWTNAAEISAEATLSSATAEVGEPVDLQIVVTGARGSSAPEVSVDGLTVQHTGDSTNMQVNNFQFTSSVTHSYTVLPQRAGTFTIPSLRIDVGGKTVSTQPLTLTVAASAQSAQNGQQGQRAGSPANKYAFAEWLLPKTKAYVGEMIPVELRLYLDPAARPSLQRMPTVNGDGFMVQKFPQPKQTNITKNGQNVIMVIFKTAITAVKPGKLTLPPADIEALLALPQRRGRSNLPSMPGFPDLSNDPLFGAFLQQQEVKIQPDPVELEIMPLPAIGRPKSFSGGVGQFTLQIKASPVHLHAGDPITVTADISGMGNFDRMEAPSIADEPGWRAYPPSGKFKPDDELGISGTKTFETALIPESPKENLPAIEFSYFDPSQEKYVTLTGERTPLVVEGSAIPSPTPSAVANAGTPSNSPKAPPQPKANDILYIRTDAGRWGATFEPAWQTRSFWLFQLAPLAALLAFGGWQLRQNRLNDLRARRIATLRAARAEAVKMLHRDPVEPGDFYDAAIRVIQLDAALSPVALKSGREPTTVDAETACNGRTLDPDTGTAVRRLFASHDELRYAGNNGQGESLSPERRAAVMQTLERFEKSHE